MSVKLKTPLEIRCYALNCYSSTASHRITLPIMSTFSEESLFYDENSPEYKTGYLKINPFLREGNNQLSMLILEIFFICKCVPQGTKALVVYVGGAPGDHINYLAEYFPLITFHVYDIKKMEKIVERDNLKKFVQRFDRDTCALYKNQECYLISDIRDPDFNNEGKNLSEMLDADMSSQLEWGKEIRPLYALFRYRPKLKSENSSDRNRYYFEYPKAYVLKISFLKKLKSIAAFFIIKDFDSKVKYYHDHMASIISNHIMNVQNANVYENPLKGGLQMGFFDEKEVIRVAEKLGKTFDIQKLLSYVCGVDWDHRVLYYVFSLYSRYMGFDDSRIPELALTPYISMQEEIPVTAANEDIYRI